MMFHGLNARGWEFGHFKRGAGCLQLLTGDGLSSRLQAGRQPAAGLPTGPTVQENR